MRRIYIAGALNASATYYIKNLHHMIRYGDEVRRLGCAVFIPGIDFLSGDLFVKSRNLSVVDLSDYPYSVRHSSN